MIKFMLVFAISFAAHAAEPVRGHRIDMRGLSAQGKKDLLISYFQKFGKSFLNLVVAVEFADLNGREHLEVVKGLPAQAYGDPAPVEQSGGLNLVYGSDGNFLSYSSSTLISFYIVTPLEQELDVTVRFAAPAGPFPIGEKLLSLKERAKGFLNFDEFLKTEAAQESYFLGLSYYGGLLDFLEKHYGFTGPRDRGERKGFYSRFGVQPGQPGHVRTVISKLLAQEKPVYFFVPPAVLDRSRFHVVREEMEELMKSPDLSRVTFVFGAYDFLSREEYYRAAEAGRLMERWEERCAELLKP